MAGQVDAAGGWVARKNGRVIVRAATARELVARFGRMGRKAVGAVAKWEKAEADRD